VVADVEVEQGVVARRVQPKRVLLRPRRFRRQQARRVHQRQQVNAEAELEVEALQLRHSRRRIYRNTAAW
jgi:hypothetical protein